MIIIDIEKEGLSTTVLDNGEVVIEPPADGNLSLDFHLEDSYPDFPCLTDSIARGCGFCGLLREEILKHESHRFADTTGDVGEKQIKVSIDLLRYSWPWYYNSDDEQVKYLYCLYAHRTVTGGSGGELTPDFELYFDIETDSGKL